MTNRPGRIRPRAVAACLVLLLHALILLVLLRGGWAPARPAAEEFVSVFLQLERNQRDLVLDEVPTAPSRDQSVPRPSAPAVVDGSVTLPPLVAPATDVDWSAARAQHAQELGRALAAPGPRVFGKVQPSRPFKTCRRKDSSWEWKPEPGRVGLAGGFLPYVRLGKRCAVGLGFFGCTLDEPPPANGELLADMRDPDRPTSSVPSEADCLPDELPLR